MQWGIRSAQRRFALLLFAIIGSLFGLGAALTTFAATDAGAAQTYTSKDASYSIAFSPNTQVTESDDAALRYKMVTARLPVANSPLFQGISILVIESDMTPEEYVAQAYQKAGGDPSTAVRPKAPAQINGRAALRLERDTVIGDGDKLTTLIAGDGVLYRVDLFAGDDGGPGEPTAQAVTLYEQSVLSFRVLNVPRQPKAAPRAFAPQAAAAVAIADLFNYPLHSGGGVNYGIPVGLMSADTHIEWLGYGIRNLDLWGIKCYGVDWSRMIHTGEDWYRLDGASTAGAPVYAVANGVVAKHNPGISYPGNVVIIRHRLADGRDIYSMYGHVTNVKVVEGQTVALGQQIASVVYQGYSGRTASQHPAYDAHMHFEMRWFLDGTNIYAPSTNAYGYNYPACTYAYPGRGYTYLVHPDNYPYPGKGYVEPSAFIKAHLSTTPPTSTPTPTATQPPTPTPTPTITPTPAPQACEYVRDGGFEGGVPNATWAASNSQGRNDPLIYKDVPRTGKWSAWFGNVLNYTDTLKQTVTLPANRAGATLRFWRYVRSNEAATSAKDSLQVILIGANGSETVVSTITTAVTRNRWVQATVPLNLSGISGSSVVLAFRGLNNSTYVSSFFVDDVSLAMPCGAGSQGVVEPGAQTAPAAAAASQPAEAANVVCSNLARDPGFESGKLGVGWAAIANTSSALYADASIYTVRPHTGSFGAWLGSSKFNSVWNELVQTVQLPPKVTSVQLRYWRYLETTETDRTKVYDRFTASFETEKGIQIMTPQQIDNTSAGRGVWAQQTLDLANAANYAGQKLWLSFKATTDSNLPSSLYVDDVEVNVCTTQ